VLGLRGGAEDRDRIRLATVVTLAYGATEAQVRHVTAGIEQVLRAHPLVWPDAVVARLSNLSAAAIDIDFGAFTTISANRGDPCLPFPGRPGVPNDSPVSGFVQSTHCAYSSGVSAPSPITSPAPSTAEPSARATPPSR